MSFQKDLEHLINKHSQEQPSNTPDFILAEYMMSCLQSFNQTLYQRQTWFSNVGSSGADDPKGVDSEPSAPKV